MAALATQDRFDLWADFMRRNAESITISKPDLRAAVDAIDNWVESNKTAFNAAIPQPARAALTAPQKAALFMYVVGKRFDKGA